MKDPLELLRQCVGFQWDRGNAEKNWRKHRVATWEAEQIFLNQPLVVADDEAHSLQEFALGQTNQGRLLFALFAIRGRLIRVISVRDMSARERRVYHSS